MSQKIPLHEWIIVALILAILIVITLLTTYKSSRAINSIQVIHETVIEEIEVKVEGAVENPNFFVLPKGSTVRSVLEKARPTKDADLSRLKLNQALRDGQKVKVKKKEQITVILEGAVGTKGPMIIEKGTRLEDLIEIADLAPEADRKALKKRRKLKDNEIINVAVKSEKKKDRKETGKQRKKAR